MHLKGAAYNMAQKKSKKPNPRKQPASQADVNRAKREAQNEALKLAWAILFTVLRDKEGYDLEKLRRVWTEVENLSDSIVKGYVSVSDLRNVLKEEAGINLE